LGRFAESLEYFDESLRLAQTLGDRPREAAALRAMAGAQQSLGRLEPAIDAADRALALFRSLDARWDEGLTLTHLARLHAERGDLDLASRTSGAALDVCRAVGASRCQAHALNQMGEIALARREWEPAIGHFRQALDLRVAIPDPAGQAETRLGLARAERAQGRLAPAREHAEAALALIESERARIDVDDLRASYFAVKQDAFVLAIDLFMELHALQPAAGYHVLALETSERSRARALLDMLWEAGAEIHEGVAPELRSEERQLRQRLNTLESSRMRSRAAAAGKGDAKNSEGNIQELLEQHRRLRARIRAESPRYASLTDPEPLTAEEIQRNLLDRETVLLHYALGVERSFLWLVTPQRVESFHLPARAVIETAARRAFELLEVGHTRQRRREAARALDTLARMVLGPVADRVQADRVVVVADGALGYIPFGALPVAAAPLMARHEVVSLPSASALAVLRRETSQRAPAPKLLAVLADPVLEPADPRVPGSNRGGARLEPTLAGPLLRSARDTGVNRFERLVNTRREAEAILALTGEAERLRALDFDASRETALRADLGEYRLLHFATHGLLNSRHPELSGLVLSLVDPRGQPQDGFLRAQDVYNMRLGADLVVLSACRTALGAEIRGEGLLSLVRCFMYAGAPRVVASLWNVRDDATAELMKRFYTGMIRERLAPAAALRQAQLTMSTDDRWSAPYYWAGFVLQGEWR
jgi:CHAT domain-containing protein